MALDSHADETYLSVHFLNNLTFEEDSKFAEIKASLLYLANLVAQADQDHPDVQKFATDLFDVSHKLQTEHLQGSLKSRSERMAEVFQEEVNALFISMPNELQGYHNRALNSLLPEAELGTPETSEAAPTVPKLSSKIVEAFKLKTKLQPKQLMQVLAACAALSLPSDRIQLPSGPEIWIPPAEALALSVSSAVAEATRLQLPTTDSQPTRLTLPQRPSIDPLEAPFQLALEQAPYPVDVVTAETESMARRLQFVLDTPERRTLFDTLRGNTAYRDVVALIGIIESNLDVDAVSHSGAIGIMQDMGGLQGAFGHPDTVEHLAAAGLMPVVEDATYNRIISLHQRGIEIQRGTLLDYLIAQRQANTPFWQTFETEQAKLLINSESAAAISAQYLEDLQAHAIARLPINNDPLEALNFAVMSYNLGMTHLHTLRRIMAQNDVLDFNTHTVLTFMNRPDFHTILRNNNLGQLYDNYEEAKYYLARYINLQALVAHNHSKI